MFKYGLELALGAGIAIWLFGGKLEPKILGTRACDLALWKKTFEPKNPPTRACDLSLWKKTWTQNLRDQGLRFDSLEENLNPRSWGPGPAISLFGGKLNVPMSARCCHVSRAMVASSYLVLAPPSSPPPDPVSPSFYLLIFPLKWYEKAE